MAKRSIVPFGPQHPVLPEPVHLDLVLEDETVVQAVPSIGYIHRGLEKLVDKRDFKQYSYIAERICGICSCGHGLGYCMAVEEVMGVEVPETCELSARDLGGDEPYPQPSALARTPGGRHGIRESVYGELEAA